MRTSTAQACHAAPSDHDQGRGAGRALAGLARCAYAPHGLRRCHRRLPLVLAVPGLAASAPVQQRLGGAVFKVPLLLFEVELIFA